MTNSVVDFEDLLSTSFCDSNKAVRSSVRPRWERKALAKTSSSSSLSTSSTSVKTGDRFIPNRGAMDMEISAHLLRHHAETDGGEENTSSSALNSSMNVVSEANKEGYKSVLGATMLGLDDSKGSNSSHRILSFKDKAPAPRGDTVNNLNILYSATANVSSKKSLSGSSKLVSRQIPSAPSRILDAPDLMDDYYLNLLSWSDTNILAVALSQTVYLWNAGTGDIQELCTFEGDANAHISSVAWVQEGGSHLAIGTSDGTTQLWDVRASKQLRSMDGHTERVGALSWNRHLLSSGGRDTLVVNHDVRIAHHNVATLRSHSQEVCGLAWNREGDTLASGGNDNKLCLWDVVASRASSSSVVPRYELTDHQAAVKALAWSPHERNLLATGGGTADRTIKFWNSQTGALLNSIDTESQVCALQWNPFENEILSSHGFARNQLCLWKYPSMVKIKELEGHTARVLHMACSPSGGTVVSAAADETLRFWDVFAPPSKASSKKRNATSSEMTTMKFSKTMQLR
jgi:cell division cycle protein 20 (cofactor of APC complex)